MHDDVAAIGRWLGRVVRGWFAYFAVPGSMRRVAAFRHWVVRAWLTALRRRSRTHRTTWGRIAGIADKFLPRARILHPWPEARFAVTHPRWEPGARIGHAGICAGGGSQDPSLPRLGRVCKAQSQRRIMPMVSMAR